MKRRTTGCGWRTARLRVGIIGGGNMGTAVASRLAKTAKGRYSVAVSEIDPRRRARLRRAGITAVNANAPLASDSDIIIISVKPHDVDLVLGEISSARPAPWLVISVAAGITTKKIEGRLDARTAVIRAMPNMAALVGEGVTALCRGSRAGERDVAMARSIFSSIGDVLEVEERLMDAVTAMSGSGPAYFFYLVECMVEAGLELGLKRRDANHLAIRTALGGARLLCESREPPHLLRTRVASKGGTTEAAFKVFESRKVKEIIIDAIKAACLRAKELNR